MQFMFHLSSNIIGCVALERENVVHKNNNNNIML